MLAKGPHLPKISIITTTYNSAKTLADTIKCIQQQTYPNIEHILIDGASKDNTLTLIHHHLQQFPKYQFLSEPDKGIYDAMNKGIQLATGDYICFLNSDDFYVNKYVIENVVTTIQSNNNPDAVYGNLWYVDKQDTDAVYRFWQAGNFRRYKMLFGWMAPHPTFFVKREIIEKYGPFKTGLTLAADYEMMVRLLFFKKCSVAYLPRILVKMRLGGQGNKAIKNRMVANQEDRIAWRYNGYFSPLIYFITICKPLRKVLQFLPFFKKKILQATLPSKQPSLDLKFTAKRGKNK